MQYAWCGYCAILFAFGDITGFPPVPRIRSTVCELDSALVLGTHLAMLIRILAIPKACRIQHIKALSHCWGTLKALV